ncbi:DUF982 domain-containing protein [Phyllobacterium myrsinacearum]|uniref:DUF982 domain-containing protein n=2 Tax=Phyllobacterium myrsinacearum TaxID=28101 RepID=A0A2S9JDG2_9HYPH|nr:DUF982 domain-containing protein [Phyllobacterium myrsinacearum]RZU97770.1 uncharacterized protein DUF982 [Phyllobacterium myrsinacearum]
MNTAAAMRKLSFPYVTIETGRTGTLRNITCVEEAFEWLTLYWPKQYRGARWSMAHQACIDATNRKASVTSVQKAFIEAAKEAGIYFNQQKFPVRT